MKDNAPDVNKMKKSIFASLYHCMSTDTKPQHSKCPVGAESWCFFQRAIAQGETPKSHKKMKTTLSELVDEKILPVYQRLASDEMLSKCISAKTQNANESLHSCIWRKCPKEVFISKKRLELGVHCDASDFGVGSCLTRQNTDEFYIPIAFASQKFNTTQKNWASIEKEAWAVLFGLNKFDKWIYGAKVEIISDHNPLKYLNQTTPKSPKLSRWALALQRWNHSITHRLGVQHRGADALSRLE
ncbi:hypothetical protein AVEN_133513-1 [Araneus ventricosus]|uniref:Reverse transcriptase RNase H-like domain-containing protein n=1 Tax=Araneus ventricosus TaxID=182803 RepID=A0A4Y2P0J8_ARAVE|nr:hypothetical protein AVEN_133513-1 [Araneus ventricosus]